MADSPSNIPVCSNNLRLAAQCIVQSAEVDNDPVRSRLYISIYSIISSLLLSLNPNSKELTSLKGDPQL